MILKTKGLSNRLIPDKPLANVGYPAPRSVFAYPVLSESFIPVLGFAYPARVLLILGYPSAYPEFDFIDIVPKNSAY